ncbi:MAG TPA: DUF4832 domain-containing protein [Cytophagaceae bacterium]
MLCERPLTKFSIAISFWIFLSVVKTYAVLPSAWSNADIGNTGALGNASYNNGTFTVSGSGHDIWDYADGFHYVYQPITGTDLEVVAQVNSIANTNEWAKAGLMIREELTAGAKHASAFITALNGAAFQYRANANGISYHLGTSGNAPVWLKLQRKGNVFTAYKSNDGINWESIASSTLTMAENIYVGLAVTSHHWGIINTSSFSHVSINTFGLPHPWVNSDVGTTGAAGNAVYSDGTFTLEGAGADIWDYSDGFHFVYQPITTNVEIITRVDNLTNTDEWAKAGVMIRETLAHNAPHAMAVVTRSNGTALQYRSVTGGISYHYGSTGTAPLWVKLTRTGDVFNAYKSSDGLSWTSLGSTTISMAQQVYVGLVVTSHNAGVINTARFSQVTVNTGNPNQLPTVSIISPVNTAEFSANATIPIMANASDPDGTISKVEFYNGNTKLGEDNSAPYTFNWNNVAAGSYMLTARAYDNTGAYANSSPISIVVHQSIPLVTVNYSESNEDFPNPERGFYRYTETKASNYSVLTVSQLRDFRNFQQPWNANYSVAATLIFRYYILDIFTNSPLSGSFLTNFAKDCQAAREAGVKLIPRFTYTVSTNSTGCPDNTACPPYGDASKATVLNHINQLKPYFMQNADVIATVQMGFVGIWGEQYYTDHFGDASSNGQGRLLDQNWRDRSEVLQALLDALPADRFVQVRYPQMKQRFVYGVNAPVTSAALTDVEAFSGSAKSRIGFHNDCYLSGPNDIGTYFDYGNSSTWPKDATNLLRNYFSNDSKFVPAGGETCSDGFSPQNDCEPIGKALAEFRMMHYSYLNADYNNNVNNDWQSGGCMDEIKKNLGYRLVLKKATFPAYAVTNSSITISFEIENKGFASPFNERYVYLVLKNLVNGQVYSIKLSTDIRRWYTGAVNIQETLTLPSQITPGEYDLYLHMPDKYASIASRPEYAIRLANTGLWEATTGYNKLNHKLVINAGGGSRYSTDAFDSNNIHKIQLTPNPTTGIVTIQLPEGNKADSYSLYSTLGEEISNVTLNAMESFDIDLTGTKAGMYFLKIKTSDGDYIERLVIH